jgi:hypothetical protein
MPAKTPPEPDPTPATPDTTTIDTAAPVVPVGPEPVLDVPPGRLPAGTYEYTGSLPTQYLEVPLTARPQDPGRPATDDEPAVPATPATVFDWPFSAPDDGRWKPTKKKPNQQPDNAPAIPEGE